MSTALVRIEAMTGAELFKPGVIDPIFEQIAAEAKDQADKLDISREEDRVSLASLAYKIACTKTFFDTKGKSLVANAKKEIAKVDAERRRVWDKFESLQSEVRQPLTTWEQTEKDRVAAHEARIVQIVELGIVPFGASTEEIEQRLAQVSAIDPASFEEFAKRAAGSQASAAAYLRTALEASKEAAAKIAEADRLRKEADERAIKDREDAAAKAAKEVAERKAEEQARIAREAAEAERQRIENERVEAEARAKQSEERRKREAEEAQKHLEAEKLAAERRAKEAATQAKRDQEAAVEAERQRAESQKKREREEAEARERNKNHKAKINREAKEGLIRATGIDSEFAEEAIAAIVKGLVPHVTISY